MTLDEKRKHLSDFITLYNAIEENETKVGRKGYVAEAHNLCSAIVETQSGTHVYYSTSAYGQIRKEYQGLFIQNLNTKAYRDFCDSLPAFQKGVLGHHTEFQLINYIYTNIMTFVNPVHITLFSAIKVCPSCFKMLENFQTAYLNLDVYELDVRNNGLVEANLCIGTSGDRTIHVI